MNYIGLHNNYCPTFWCVCVCNVFFAMPLFYYFTVIKEEMHTRSAGHLSLVLQGQRRGMLNPLESLLPELSLLFLGLLSLVYLPVVLDS